MAVSLRTPKLSRASVRGKSKRGQLAATYRDRAGLLEDDFSPVTEDEIEPTEKEYRFGRAASNEGYRKWFKANRPDEYAEWLKKGASDCITTSTSTQCTATLEGGLAREIQGILAASERLCLPAPKVEAMALLLPASVAPAIVYTRNNRTGQIMRQLADGRLVVKINCPLFYWEIYSAAELEAYRMEARTELKAAA